MTSAVRLGEVVKIERGVTYKSSLLDLPGPTLLGLGSIQRNGGYRADSLRTYGGESPQKLLVRPGGLYASLKDVTQTADLLGAVARVPQDGPVGRLTQDTVRLDLTSSRVTPSYLYWMLRTPQYRQYCKSHATGTTTMGLPRDDFFAFEFPEPSATTRTIVDLLDAIEAKITADTRSLALADGLVRAKFDSLVGPPMRLGDIASNIRQQVDPSELELATPYVGLEHIPRRSVWLAEWDFASKVSSAKARFEPGDVLFGKLRPYFHKVVRASFAGIASTDVLVVRADDARLAGLVLGVASSDVAVSRTSAATEGTRMPRTKWADLADVSFPWPGDEEALRFSTEVGEICHWAGSLVEQSHRLAATRDGLLSLLMSGQLQVKDGVA